MIIQRMAMMTSMLITARSCLVAKYGKLKMLRFSGLKMSLINDKLYSKAPEVAEPKQFTTLTLVLLVWKNMMIKNMTISYKPGTDYLDSKPMPYIRITNKFLQKYGFEHGDKIVVKYQKGKITITKHEQHNRD